MPLSQLQIKLLYGSIYYNKKSQHYEKASLSPYSLPGTLLEDSVESYMYLTFSIIQGLSPVQNNIYLQAMKHFNKH